MAENDNYLHPLAKPRFLSFSVQLSMLRIEVSVVKKYLVDEQSSGRLNEPVFYLRSSE